MEVILLMESKFTRMKNGSYRQIRIMFRKLHSSVPRVCTNNYRKLHGKAMKRWMHIEKLLGEAFYEI